jgi:hypothetical protein
MLNKIPICHSDRDIFSELSEDSADRQCRQLSPAVDDGRADGELVVPGAPRSGLFAILQRESVQSSR